MLIPCDPAGMIGQNHGSIWKILAQDDESRILAMRRPVVGVIGNAHRIENRFTTQMVGERNLRAVADVSGALPLMFAGSPEITDIGALLDAVDGVVLTGARANVHPTRFKTEPHERHEPYDVPRDDVALALFRVAQESLRNIAKHSRANSASVRLTIDSFRTVLEIEDDGLGLVDDKKLGEGIGMFTMRERLELVDGTFEIWAKAEGGTAVRAIAPTRPFEHVAGFVPPKTA